MNPAVVRLAVVTAQRLGELALSHRNTRNLLARGAQEVGAKHYPLMVGLHAAWLAGLWVWGRGHGVNLFWLAVFLALQLLRVWVIATLGERWTTRIIMLAGAPLVRKGPYRFLAHPNYAIVIGEIAALPLALGMPLYAAVFFVLNGLMLWIRITTENRALQMAG